MLISTQAVNISQKYSDMYLRPRNGVLLVEALSILWINLEHSPNSSAQPLHGLGGDIQCTA